MQDVMATVRDIAESVRAVTTQLERSFGTDTAGQQMQSVLRNLSEALERINATIQANADLISSTIRNIEGTTAAAGPGSSASSTTWKRPRGGSTRSSGTTIRT